MSASGSNTPSAGDKRKRDIERDLDQEGSDISDDTDQPGKKSLTKADKRAHHNALERKRRDHIKDSFSVLRDSIPNLKDEKASRAQILNKATDYIQLMRKKNTAHQSELEELKAQNAKLAQQAAELELEHS